MSSPDIEINPDFDWQTKRLIFDGEAAYQAFSAAIGDEDTSVWEGRKLDSAEFKEALTVFEAARERRIFFTKRTLFLMDCLQFWRRLSLITGALDPPEIVAESARKALQRWIDQSPKKAVSAEWILTNEKTLSSFVREVRLLTRSLTTHMAEVWPAEVSNVIDEKGLLKYPNSEMREPDLFDSVDPFTVELLPTHQLPDGSKLHGWDEAFFQWALKSDLIGSDELNGSRSNRAKKYTKSVSGGDPYQALSLWWSGRRIQPSDEEWKHQPIPEKPRLRFLELIAYWLWEQSWQEKAKKAERRSHYVSALTVEAAEQAIALFNGATHVTQHDDQWSFQAPGTKSPQGLMTQPDIASLLQDVYGAAQRVDVVERVAANLIRSRQSIAGVYTFLHSIRTVTNLARDGQTNYRASWDSWKEWASEVANLAGLKPTNSLRAQLIDVAWFGNVIQLPLLDGRTQRGLWTLRAPDPKRRGRRSKTSSQVVTFNYDDILCPVWARLENPTDGNRGVQLMHLPERMPLIESTKFKSNAAIYGLLLLVEVNRLTTSSAVEDGVELTKQDRLLIADRAKLPHSLEQEQLDRLKDEGWLEEAGTNRLAIATKEGKSLAAHTHPLNRRRKPKKKR